MIAYIGGVFYLSEPKYIDSCYKKPERYDWVSIPERYTHDDTSVENGIVLQVDSIFAVVKVKDYRDRFCQLNLKESKYRIIGKGTIYHKVNDYVGFNIMIISQVIIGILTGLLIIFMTSTLKDVL